jgi:hypothetical protein
MGIGVKVVISPLVPLCEDQVRVGDHLWDTDEVSSGLKPDTREHAAECRTVTSKFFF